MIRNMSCFALLTVVSLLLFNQPLGAVPGLPPFGLYTNQPFSPTITVVASGSDEIILRLRMEHLPHGQTLSFDERFAGTWGEMNPTGILIPRFTIFLALPAHGNPSAVVDWWDAETFSVVPVTVPENNPDGPSVVVGSVGILGGVRVAPVTFRPVRYVNLADTCSVLDSAIVRIVMDSTTGTNPVTTPRSAFSRPWQQLFQAVVTNWEDIPNIAVSQESHILMIVPDSPADSVYVPNVARFVRWKEQRGIKVTIVVTSSIGSNPTASQVRDRIITEVNSSSPRIDFVIFVGDEEKVPVFTRYTYDSPSRFSSETYAGTYTDEGRYAAFEGTDVFPDVFLGRWVVNTGEGVLKVAGKVVLHERDSFAADSLRFERGLMGADQQLPSQRQTKLEVRDRLLAVGLTTVDTVFQFGPQLVMQAINAGENFVNYRGTGWASGWAGVGFYTFHINQLTNVRKLPIVTGIGCGGAIFYDPHNDTPGFGETFLKAGTTSQPRGAVAFIGPTWNTHTVFNDCLDSLLYRSWLEYRVQQLMPGLVAGKMMVWALFAPFLGEANVNEVVQTMFRQYIVQGDPSLQVFTDTPQRLLVTLPDHVSRQPSSVPVTVNNMASLTADSLNLTVWISDGVFASAWIPHDGGSASVLVDPQSADTVVVTITGDNALAYQTSLPVVPADVPEQGGGVIPTRLELGQNYPNPFNAATRIRFGLPHSSRVRLEVFDILGRQVATLMDGQESAGWHTIEWHPAGDGLGSGIYFYRLHTGDEVAVRKMVLLQ